MGKLDDRVVLVTGGQRGLGAAALREIAAEGATCVVNYPAKLEKEAADALVKEIKGQGVDALAIAADVTEDEQVAAMIERIKQRFGRLDVLVNNAGSTLDAQVRSRGTNAGNMPFAIKGKMEARGQRQSRARQALREMDRTVRRHPQV